MAEGRPLGYSMSLARAPPNEQSHQNDMLCHHFSLTKGMFLLKPLSQRVWFSQISLSQQVGLWTFLDFVPTSFVLDTYGVGKFTSTLRQNPCMQNPNQELRHTENLLGNPHPMGRYSPPRVAFIIATLNVLMEVSRPAPCLYVTLFCFKTLLGK